MPAKVKPAKVKLNLVGLNGNAFAIMGAFAEAANRQGWSQAEISKVLDDARSGDYDHLLVTIMNATEEES